MRLALGTVQFGIDYGVAGGTRLADVEAGAILATARAAGIDTLDTATAYGDAESRLGQLGVAGWRAITKIGAVPDGCADVGAWVDRELRASLERLRVGRLGAVLLHRPAQLRGAVGGRLHDALCAARAAGLVDAIGVSIYDPEELDDLPFRVDLVQGPFNVIDRRLSASGWLGRLAGEGVEVHVRSILLQGLLAMPAASRPARFARWAPVWQRWEAWLHETRLTPIEACVRFALSFPQVHRVVVGVDSAAQLRELLAAASAPPLQVPDDLAVPDPDLVNPSRWSTL